MPSLTMLPAPPRMPRQGQEQRHALIRAEVGRRVRLHRQMQGISRKVLADALGVTVSQVAKYESGIDMMAASTLYRIAAVLQTSVASLLQGADSATAAAEGMLPLPEVSDAADHTVFALVANFQKIRDRELRRLLIRAVERMAAQPAPAAATTPGAIGGGRLDAALAEAG